MSIQKDMSKVKKPNDLSDDEYTILQAQGRLPKGFPFREDLVNNPTASGFTSANTGTVAIMSTEDLEAELERRKALETQPSIGDNGGIEDDDEDEDVPYEDQTNKQLRALLAARDLDVGGNKEELVARLEESDAAGEGE